MANDGSVLYRERTSFVASAGLRRVEPQGDSVMQFQKALNDTGITNEIYVYPNVGHAFANPSNDNYAPTETADAWKKTLDFLGKYLQN